MLVRWGVVLLVIAASCGGSDPSPADTSAQLSAAPETSSTAAAATDQVVDTSEPATTTRAAPTDPVSAADGCAHVIAGEIVWQGETATVSATVRSADTGWDKYADAWEVRSLDGEVLGVRELLHPHETEQPFTRSLAGVVIPSGTAEVVLAARDSVDGWCGTTLVVPVPLAP